jgi:hypothetical protein
VPARRLRTYLALVGALLLLQGSASLLLHEALALNLSSLHGFLTPNDRHAILHVVWGLMILAVLALKVSERTVIWFGFVFGVFYVALGVLGIVVHDPFGLHLGWGENVFHLLIGPLALIFASEAALR